MFAALTSRFKDKPSLYYSMSIAATWAGVGSLMVGIQMAQDYGILPFLIWALGNTLACMVFGIAAPLIPRLREIFRSRAMRIVTGVLCVFQVWVNLNGIQTIFATTPLTETFGMVLAYVSAIVFIAALLKFGMIRNVLSDNASWLTVYCVAAILTVCAIVYSQGDMRILPLGVTPTALGFGLEKCLLLLPGPFLYPYFYEILDYNERNEEGINKTDVQRAFVMGGLLFCAYLIFTFLLSWTNFSPLLSVVKAFLITLVALSTLSSFLYSIYITFGRKLGIAVNAACVALWQFLVPMGVLGVWTLMAKLRICIVIGSVLLAIAWHLRESRKGVRA